MAFCNNCGASLNDDVRFCSKCGTAVTFTASGTAGVVPPPSSADTQPADTQPADIQPVQLAGTPPAGAQTASPVGNFVEAPATPSSTGAPPPANAQSTQPINNSAYSYTDQTSSQSTWASPTGTQADPADVQANKAMAMLAYLFFFIPLLAGTYKTSPYVRFHANQGTVLFIMALAYSGAIAILRTIGTTVLLSARLWVFMDLFLTLLVLINLVPLVFVILGMIAAANGQLKPLPIIGAFSVFK